MTEAQSGVPDESTVGQVEPDGTVEQRDSNANDLASRPPTQPPPANVRGRRRWYRWWVYERGLRPRALVTLQWLAVPIALVAGRAVDESGWAFVVAVAIVVVPSAWVSAWVAWALPVPQPLAEHSLAGATIVRAGRTIWGSVLLVVGAVAGAMVGTSYQWLVENDPGTAATKLMDGAVLLVLWVVALMSALAFLTLMVRIGRTDKKLRARAAAQRNVPVAERPADELWARWMSSLAHVWTTVLGVPLLLTCLALNITAQ